MDFNYDPQNIFAKILRGEIPNKTVYENDTPSRLKTSHRKRRSIS